MYKETLTRERIEQDLRHLAKISVLSAFVLFVATSILLVPLLTSLVLLVAQSTPLPLIAFCVMEGLLLFYVAIVAFFDCRVARGKYRIYERTLLGKDHRRGGKNRIPRPHRLFFKDMTWHLRALVKHYIWRDPYMTDNDIFEDAHMPDTYILVGMTKWNIYIGYNKKRFEPDGDSLGEIDVL